MLMSRLRRCPKITKSNTGTNVIKHLAIVLAGLVLYQVQGD